MVSSRKGAVGSRAFGPYDWSKIRVATALSQPATHVCPPAR